MEDKNIINENNNPQEEQAKNEEENQEQPQKLNLLVTLSYYNKEIENFPLPYFFDEFHFQFLSYYNISSPKNFDEPISIIYYYSNEQGEKETAQVKTSEQYTLMLSRIKESKLLEGKKIFVETSNYPPGVGREDPKDFEGEIKMVVERELKIAEENIKKNLVGKKYCNLSTKRQKNRCSKCNELIIGDMYKEVMKDEDSFYCEKCSNQISNPLFVIH